MVLVDGTSYGEERAEFTRLTGEMGVAWLRRPFFRDELRQLPLMRLGPRPGYSMTTARLTPKESGRAADRDAAYEAVMSVTQAAVQVARARDEAACAMVLPVIAVRDQLFEAWLGFNDKLQVHEVDSHQLRWVGAPGNDPVIIDVVTESALDGFADDASTTAEAMVTQTAPEAREAAMDGLGTVY